ncbi:hypothetical protein N9H57_07085 [Flavobacteriaceae bacterium]|nr:hypothetical protein [Flavobacteriaceae bacterium]MDA9572283.1 hypothetical protein [Flavobacteriaceae bacterium]MDB3862603.1 hypothetical protein [Flavobacteriaceae bacterium]MDC3354854.1 hypothetical protein [Flavobacteriaceae bacterium]
MIPLNFNLLLFISLILCLNQNESQQVPYAPKRYVFTWQKANGDQYEIPVKNNLEVKIEQKRIDRALMQVLLKSVLKSRDFETFNPTQVTLFPDVDNMVAKLDFTVIGNGVEEQELTYYFNFDAYGNVFDQFKF